MSTTMAFALAVAWGAVAALGVLLVVLRRRDTERDPAWRELQKDLESCGARPLGSRHISPRTDGPPPDANHHQTPN